MLGGRHGGKPRIRLLRQLTRLRGSKEGQDIIWHAACFPKRLPPINTNGTAGIRISKRAQGSTRQFRRSEEHTSELQSLMRISYAVFCLKKKKKKQYNIVPKYRTSTYTQYTIDRDTIHTFMQHK